MIVKGNAVEVTTWNSLWLSCISFITIQNF